MRRISTADLIILIIILAFLAYILSANPMIYAMSTSEEPYTTAECRCFSNKTGKSYNFCYADPQKPESYGIKFSCSFVETLEYLDLLEDNNTISYSESIKNESSVVFVSATSEDHLNYSMTSYNAVRQFYPNHKYMLFGLNLNSDATKNLPWNDPNFEFREFNTTAYPKYVKNFKSYNFKALIIAEVIRDYPVVWWIDAHLEMIKPGVIGKWFKEVSNNRMSKEHSQLTSFGNTSHSNYAVLHEDLLGYFPSHSVKVLQNQIQLQAGNLFVPRTAYNKKILKWYVLCSLTDECINPPTAQLKCNFKKDRLHEPANCFRYDQSVLNLLLLNDFQDSSKFYGDSLDSSFRRMW